MVLRGVTHSAPFRRPLPGPFPAQPTSEPLQSGRSRSGPGLGQLVLPQRTRRRPCPVGTGIWEVPFARRAFILPSCHISQVLEIRTRAYLGSHVLPTTQSQGDTPESARACEHRELDILAGANAPCEGNNSTGIHVTGDTLRCANTCQLSIFLPRTFICVQKPHSADAIKRRHIQADTHSNAIPGLLLRQDDPSGGHCPALPSLQCGPQRSVPEAGARGGSWASEGLSLQLFILGVHNTSQRDPLGATVCLCSVV